MNKNRVLKNMRTAHLENRIVLMENRVQALEMVAKRYADLKPKLDEIYTQLHTLVERLEVANKGE